MTSQKIVLAGGHSQVFLARIAAFQITPPAA